MPNQVANGWFREWTNTVLSAIRDNKDSIAGFKKEYKEDTADLKEFVRESQDEIKERMSKEREEIKGLINDFGTRVVVIEVRTEDLPELKKQVKKNTNSITGLNVRTGISAALGSSIVLLIAVLMKLGGIL